MNAVENQAIISLMNVCSDEFKPYIKYVESALKFREEFQTPEEFYGVGIVATCEGLNPGYRIDTYEKACDYFSLRLIRELVYETAFRDFKRLHDEIVRFENDIYIMRQIFGKK